MDQGPGGGQKFAKFVTLEQLYELSMFPSFIVSDANYDFITCNSSSLLLPLPRCNENPDCRNPRGFRIAINKDKFFAKPHFVESPPRVR